MRRCDLFRPSAFRWPPEISLSAPSRANTLSEQPPPTVTIPETTLVRGSMVKKMYYCFEDQSLEEARELMRRHHLLHLPVVDKDLRIIGVVALNDVEDANVQGDVSS